LNVFEDLGNEDMLDAGFKVIAGMLGGWEAGRRRT
jgi:hypothetical protein